MQSFFLAIGSVLAVSLASLAGICFVGLSGKSLDRWLFVLISFAVGGLLGEVFIHLLPEIAEGNDDFFSASLLIAGGILLSFVLEKIIHWRHCHSVECRTHARSLGSMVLIGDAAHNIVDGIIIAGAYLTDVRLGVITTIAVVLHEIPQEIGDYAILLYSGYSRSKALLLNLLTALTAVLGVIAVFALRETVGDIEYFLLPLVAGNFLYIAVSDLLPELHKQTHIRHSLLQLTGVLTGLLLMFSLTFLE